MDWIRKKKSWKSKKQKENNVKNNKSKVNPDVKYAIDRKVKQKYIGVFILHENKDERNYKRRGQEL